MNDAQPHPKLLQHVSDLIAITNLQHHLISALYERCFADSPGEFAALMDRMEAGLRAKPRDLEPSSAAAVGESAVNVIAHLQLFRRTIESRR